MNAVYYLIVCVQFVNTEKVHPMIINTAQYIIVTDENVQKVGKIK